MNNIWHRFDLVDKKKVMLIAGLLALLIYADLSFVLKAQLTGLNQANNKISRLKNELASLNLDLEKMRQLNEGGPAVGSGIQRIFLQDELPVLMRDIANLAVKYGIKVIQMSQIEETKSKDARQTASGLEPLKISLQVICAYHPLVSFLTELESGSDYIAVRDIKITTPPADYPNQRVEFVLTTYVRK